jgi:hypothetical protein
MRSRTLAGQGVEARIGGLDLYPEGSGISHSNA